MTSSRRSDTTSTRAALDAAVRAGPLPRVIVFDLDGTLWQPEMYQLHGGAPFRAHPRDEGVMLDQAGTPVHLIGETRDVLEHLLSSPAWRRTHVAISSTCDYPAWARELLSKYTLTRHDDNDDNNSDDKSKNNKASRVHMGAVFGDLMEIHNARKSDHHRSIMQKVRARDDSVPDDYTQMLFFDNQRDNVHDVSQLGVVCCHCHRGLTPGVFVRGLEMWRAQQQQQQASTTRSKHFTLRTEAATRDVMTMLLLHKVHPQVRADVKQRLRQLIEEAYAAHAPAPPAHDTATATQVCRAVVDDVVTQTLRVAVPSAELERQQRVCAELQQRLCDAQAARAAQDARYAELQATAQQLRRAHAYMLQCYFREVRLLRVRVAELTTRLQQTQRGRVGESGAMAGGGRVSSFRVRRHSNSNNNNDSRKSATGVAPATSVVAADDDGDAATTQAAAAADEKTKTTATATPRLLLGDLLTLVSVDDTAQRSTHAASSLSAAAQQQQSTTTTTQQCVRDHAVVVHVPTAQPSPHTATTAHVSTTSSVSCSSGVDSNNNDNDNDDSNNNNSSSRSSDNASQLQPPLQLSTTQRPLSSSSSLTTSSSSLLWQQARSEHDSDNSNSGVSTHATTAAAAVVAADDEEKAAAAAATAHAHPRSRSTRARFLSHHALQSSSSSSSSATAERLAQSQLHDGAHTIDAIFDYDAYVRLLHGHDDNDDDNDDNMRRSSSSGKCARHRHRGRRDERSDGDGWLQRCCCCCLALLYDNDDDSGSSDGVGERTTQRAASVSASRRRQPLRQTTPRPCVSGRDADKQLIELLRDRVDAERARANQQRWLLHTALHMTRTALLEQLRSLRDAVVALAAEQQQQLTRVRAAVATAQAHCAVLLTYVAAYADGVAATVAMVQREATARTSGELLRMSLPCLTATRRTQTAAAAGGRAATTRTGAVATAATTNITRPSHRGTGSPRMAVAVAAAQARIARVTDFFAGCDDDNDNDGTTRSVTPRQATSATTTTTVVAVQEDGGASSRNNDNDHDDTPLQQQQKQHATAMRWWASHATTRYAQRVFAMLQMLAFRLRMRRVLQLQQLHRARDHGKVTATAAASASTTAAATASSSSHAMTHTTRRVLRSRRATLRGDVAARSDRDTASHATADTAAVGGQRRVQRRLLHPDWRQARVGASSRGGNVVDDNSNNATRPTVTWSDAADAAQLTGHELLQRLLRSRLRCVLHRTRARVCARRLEALVQLQDEQQRNRYNNNHSDSNSNVEADEAMLLWQVAMARRAQHATACLHAEERRRDLYAALLQQHLARYTYTRSDSDDDDDADNVRHDHSKRDGDDSSISDDDDNDDSSSAAAARRRAELARLLQSPYLLDAPAGTSASLLCAQDAAGGRVLYIPPATSAQDNNNSSSSSSSDDGYATSYVVFADERIPLAMHSHRSASSQRTHGDAAAAAAVSSCASSTSAFATVMAFCEGVQRGRPLGRHRGPVYLVRDDDNNDDAAHAATRVRFRICDAAGDDVLARMHARRDGDADDDDGVTVCARVPMTQILIPAPATMVQPPPQQQRDDNNNDDEHVDDGDTSTWRRAYRCYGDDDDDDAAAARGDACLAPLYLVPLALPVDAYNPSPHAPPPQRLRDSALYSLAAPLTVQTQPPALTMPYNQLLTSMPRRVEQQMMTRTAEAAAAAAMATTTTREQQGAQRHGGITTASSSNNANPFVCTPPRVCRPANAEVNMLRIEAVPPPGPPPPRVGISALQPSHKQAQTTAAAAATMTETEQQLQLAAHRLADETRQALLSSAGVSVVQTDALAPHLRTRSNNNKSSNATTRTSRSLATTSSSSLPPRLDAVSLGRRRTSLRLTHTAVKLQRRLRPLTLPDDNDDDSNDTRDGDAHAATAATSAKTTK